MALTDIKIKQSKPREKNYRIYDEKGMYLEISPSGGKWWRLKYRVAGKEKRLSLGVYPEVSLSQARAKWDAHRKQLAAGVDPGIQKKVLSFAAATSEKQGVEVVAREWHEKWKRGVAESTSTRDLGRLENHILPMIGQLPMKDLTPHIVLRVLQRAEERSTETARRVKQILEKILRYACATGRAERNFIPDLKDATKYIRKTKHFASFTTSEQLGPFLRNLYQYRGSLFPVVCALRLAPHLFLRPGELRLGEWSEVKFDKALWEIPGTRTKRGRDLFVPLSTQAMSILRDLHDYTGSGRYIFSGRGGRRPISNNTINNAIKNMGYSTQDDMTGHGFRAAARTILDEELKFRVDWIEHQLGHSVKDANGTAYNRTTHLDGRTEMMQAWSDHLDELITEAEK